MDHLQNFAFGKDHDFCCRDLQSRITGDNVFDGL